MKLLTGLLLLAAQTTLPALQIPVEHNGRILLVIVASEVAERVANGTQTDEDRAAVAVAIELELGHLGEQRANPCHRPLSNLINEGRLPTNLQRLCQPSYAVSG